uniref:Subtilisin-like protease SBT5.3 n=1 Tax=Nelumbo nucifera TaxID=4432 RepID=A0A822ZUE7_NELNU|nr:TPA_asm: hypothetical protein HUJ06_018530 [Nelumbo nucifera]
MEFTIVVALFVLFGFSFLHESSSTITKQHYIVYMGDQHSYPDSDSVISANHEMLASFVGSIDGAQQAAVHHYTKSFRGFSAMLTAEQAEKLSESESVVSVFESRTIHLHTTHSWEFLGVDSIHQYNQLPIDVKSDMIIGVIDTGIWPESESFNDRGLGPVPKRFKGECVTGDNFTLANSNRKVIGARYYWKGAEAENGRLESLGFSFFRSGRDENGHGSHTASTVGGSMVRNISLYRGIGRGVARGGAPSARLSVYKVCWGPVGLCSVADVLSAFDDSIDDGVDIISISLGSTTYSYSIDIAIGAFHAFRKGILVSASAGNFYFPRTLTNVAPWILTVAASSVDREFSSHVHLGNSKILKGYSLNPFMMDGFYGVINASDAAAPSVPSTNASSCEKDSLDNTLIKGKIVVCENINTRTDLSGESIRRGGGVGMILVLDFPNEILAQFKIPGTLISPQQSQVLQAYLSTDKKLIAKISPTVTVLKTRPAPVVASFSSKGPNQISPGIIKPDIAAPGVNILAAWSPVATALTAGRPVDYNIISGTSMACPHASAIAAIIKSVHPSWSPAVIQSAIMTTATVLDNTQKPILSNQEKSVSTPFDYGSGHINPIAALDPGLVYDFDSNDAYDFICSNNATLGERLGLIGKVVPCKNPPVPIYNLNYPSIAVTNMTGISLSVNRTVTYYGEGPTVYVASVKQPMGVNVMVRPCKLRFSKVGEKKSFMVEFKPYKDTNGSFVFGELIWSNLNGLHRVRSPIALHVLLI